MPKSHAFTQCVCAFLVGGLICCIGEFIRNLGMTYLELDETQTSAFTSIVMIFLGATLTGLGIYDK